LYPIEPEIVASGDSGKPFINSTKDTETNRVMERIIKEIVNFLTGTRPSG